MPICFPTPAPKRKLQSWVTLLLLSFSLTASAQMLAHPGWKGNGLSTAPWWQHAIFYQVDAPAKESAVDFKSLTVRLDAIRSLGVDALLVPAPALPAPGSNASMPNLDDFDALVRQASSREIRVLLTLQAPANADQLSGLARFWLNHGIAGFHLVTPAGMPPEQAQAMVESVRKLASSSAGQRIVISDLDLASPASTESEPARRRSAASRTQTPAQLQIDSRLQQVSTFDAAHLRPLLAQAIEQPNLLLDLRPPSASGETQPPLARATAALALLTHPAALIDSGANLVLQPAPERSDEPSTDQVPKPVTPPQPPPGVFGAYVPFTPPPGPKRKVHTEPAPEDPLTSWYRQLASIHHDNAALRSGRKTFVDVDAQNVLAWIIQPAASGPEIKPVVVACNLSSSPVQFSLAAAIKQMNLHGVFLRTLLRSDNGMGGQDVNAITLPPFAVYVGELRR